MPPCIGHGGFLGGRAEYDHLAGQFAGFAQLREHYARADGGVTDDIVAAAVAHAGQGIVLGDDADRRTAWFAAWKKSAKGGGKTSDAALNVGTRLFKHMGQALGRLVLLQADFGVVGHPIAALNQRWGDLINLVLDFILQ